MAISKFHVSAGPNHSARARGTSKVVSVSCMIFLVVPTVLFPYEIIFDSQALQLHAQTALAKDAGKGGGNGNANGQGGNTGNGNGNGQSGNNGKGNADGQSGNTGNGSGQSENNGKGNANGQSGANGSAGTSGNVTGGTVSQSPAESRDSVEIGEPAREVQHENGMMEAIVNGRYVMKDAKDRTIINRKATPSDQLRLQSFGH